MEPLNRILRYWFISNSFLIIYALADINCVSYTECIVDCSKNNCANININGNEALSLTISCPNKNSCAQTQIKADYVQEITIFCHDMIDESCLGLTLYADYANNVNISCYTSSCNNVTIYASNVAETINLLCNGNYSCSLLQLIANDANIVNVKAFGNHALYSSIIQASNVDALLDITCSSKYAQFGCYQTKIYAPSNDKTLLHCQGYGCNSDLYLYSINGIKDFNISLNGCLQCQSPAQCIAQWKIYCGSNDYSSLARFNGDICSNTVCNCQYAVDHLSSNFINVNDYCFVMEPNIICDQSQQNKDCIINCDNIPNGCGDKNIMANSATSLIINCSSIFGGCQSTNIYCNINQCIINCIGDGMCTDTKIFADNSDSVQLNCFGDHSCTDLSISAQSIHTLLNISCIGQYSCINPNVSANDASFVIITAIGRNALFSGIIQTKSAQRLLFNFGSMDIVYGCNNTNLYLPSLSGITSLNCASNGCINIDLFIINGVENLDNITMNIHNSYIGNGWDIYCGNDYSIHSIFNGFTCDNALFCDCGNLLNNIHESNSIIYDCGDIECINKALIATDSKSLDVICPNDNSCKDSIIHCPNHSNSKCNVKCKNKMSCDGITIYGGYNVILNIDCLHSFSCNNANIHSNMTLNATINCSQPDSCTNMNIFGNDGSNLDIFCENGACDYLKINALNIRNQLQLTCSIYSESTISECTHIDLNAIGSNSVLISSNGYHGLSSSNINVQNVAQFDLLCNGQENGYGCYETNFIFLSNNNNGITNMRCFGFGCSKLYFHDLVPDESLNVEINGCGICSDINHCINTWNLYCNKNNKTESESSAFYGSSCYSSNCDCSKIDKKLIFIQNISSSQCINTSTIFTYSPSHYPTINEIYPFPTPISLTITTEIDNSSSSSSQTAVNTHQIDTIIIIVAVSLILLFILILTRKRFQQKRKDKHNDKNNVAREDGEDGVEGDIGDALDMQRLQMNESKSSNEHLSWVPLPQQEVLNENEGA